MTVLVAFRYAFVFFVFGSLIMVENTMKLISNMDHILISIMVCIIPAFSEIPALYPVISILRNKKG